MFYILRQLRCWSSKFVLFYNSRSVLTKFDPLSDLISLTFLHLAMKLLSAWMNEFVSRLWATFICIVLLARHINVASQRFVLFRLAFTINGLNISIAQYVKGGHSSKLSFSKSTIICSPILPLSLQHITHL